MVCQRGFQDCLVLTVTWSLEFTFLQAYNEKKQMGQREIQNRQCGERKGAQEG